MPQSAGLNHVWQHFSRNNKISRKNFKVPQVASRNFFIKKKNKQKNAREGDRETEYLDKKKTKKNKRKQRQRKKERENVLEKAKGK